MSTLLNSGAGSPLSLELARREIVNLWQQSGLLDNLNGLVRENIAQLYESQASQLLYEETKAEIRLIKHIRKHKLEPYG